MPRAVSNVDFKLEDINRSGRGIQGERVGEGNGEREKGGERKSGKRWRGREGEGEKMGEFSQNKLSWRREGDGEKNKVKRKQRSEACILGFF